MDIQERNNMLELEKIIEDQSREITMLNHDLLIWEEEFGRILKKYKRARFLRSDDLLCTPECNAK